MKYDEFIALSAEEQETFFNALSENEQTITDLTAERDSFKNENETLKADFQKTKEDLLKTKEMNFTLARKLDTSSHMQSAEDILHEMFIKNRRNHKW